jgi:hypothetical protein
MENNHIIHASVILITLFFWVVSGNGFLLGWGRVEDLGRKIRIIIILSELLSG